MQISPVTNKQNFSGIQKIVAKYPDGTQITNFLSKTGKTFGIQTIKPNGDISGVRTFSNGARIGYDTSHGSLLTEPYVPLEYHFPIGKNKQGRKLFVFDLKTFKENLKELTTLAGLKRYISKIENAPKVTRFEPCC